MKGLFVFGDILIIEQYPINKLTHGDVIAFRIQRENNKNDRITHRVIKINEGKLVTKGDNSRLPDFFSITKNNLIGKVTYFERNGRIHRITGGLPGLFLSKSKYYMRKCLFWIYTNICKLSIVKSIGKTLLKFFFSNIKTIKLLSPEGPITKWLLKGKVIAQRGPEKGYFYCNKPFDLIIKKQNSEDRIQESEENN